MDDSVMLKMDAAAVQAEKQLVDKLTQDSKEMTEAFMLIADWLHTWYMKAGYKRLCRIIIRLYEEHLDY